MSAYLLTSELAQRIVDKTMKIIGCNVNIIDTNGLIIGSGDPERIGELHEGAMMVLSLGRMISIDSKMSDDLHGVRPGVNLPLIIDDEVVGVIGLTGEPSALKQFGELVCMSAVMMMEQAKLLRSVAQETRLREELVLDLLQSKELTKRHYEWAQRLGIDLSVPRVAIVFGIDSDDLEVEVAIDEIKLLQNFLVAQNIGCLFAIRSLTEMIVLSPAMNQYGRWDIEEHKKRLAQLIVLSEQRGKLNIRTALGRYFEEGIDGNNNHLAYSYQTAYTTLMIGRQRMPDVKNYYYQDMPLPVLLNSLNTGWTASEFLIPLNRLKTQDTNGVLQKTLRTWFKHNLQMGNTAKALHVHRNTLEYRLTKVATITGLNIELLDDRLLMYIALQLDGKNTTEDALHETDD